jgi:hypothetical protein
MNMHKLFKKQCNYGDELFPKYFHDSSGKEYRDTITENHENNVTTVKQ